jgi:hypothetical protein
MTEQPTWFLQLQRDLNAPVLVLDGAVIDWDQCRDRFLVPLLQRLATKTSSPHPAIVRQLLEWRLAGDNVTAELSDAAAAAWAGWAAAAAAAADAWADAAAADAAADAAAAAAWAAWAARAAAAADAAAERAAQLSDLRAAVEASTQPAAGDQLLPPGYIDDSITGPDRELLLAFYTATNSEGGTADEIHIRGIRAVLAQAASGFVVPTAVQPASPVPVEEALQRLLQWGGMPGSIGYSADVALGVANWANGGMAGPLPPLPEPLRLRKAAAPAEPTPVDLAALRDSTFSDGLTAAQHRDVLRGGPDPRPPAPGDEKLEELVAFLREEADDYEACIGMSKAAQCNRVAALLQQQAATIADLEAVIAGHEGEALLAITPVAQ